MPTLLHLASLLLGATWGIGVGSSLWRQFKERKQAPKGASQNFRSNHV